MHKTNYHQANNNDTHINKYVVSSPLFPTVDNDNTTTIDSKGKQLSNRPLDPIFANSRATSTTTTTTNDNDETPVIRRASHNPTAKQKRDDDNNANANACNNDVVHNDDVDDDIDEQAASKQS